VTSPKTAQKKQREKPEPGAGAEAKGPIRPSSMDKEGRRKKGLQNKHRGACPQKCPGSKDQERRIKKPNEYKKKKRKGNLGKISFRVSTKRGVERKTGSRGGLDNSSP